MHTHRMHIRGFMSIKHVNIKNGLSKWLPQKIVNFFVTFFDIFLILTIYMIQYITNKVKLNLNNRFEQLGAPP